MEPAHQVEAAAAAAHAGGGVPETANWLTLLSELFHDNTVVQFLHHWENVVFSGLVILIMTSVAYFATRRRGLKPSGLQNLAEWLVEGLDNFVCGILGPKGREFTPFIGTLFLYILVMNLLGLVLPGMKSPTSSINTTVALAATVFLYVQLTAVRKLGLVGYADHLLGSPRNLVGLIMVPLMLPLHLLEELVRPLSLSLRLFGNILGEDSTMAALLGMGLLVSGMIKIPVGVPFQLFFLPIALVLSAIQALVFSSLSTIYIALILAAHEEGHGAHH